MGTRADGSPGPTICFGETDPSTSGGDVVFVVVFFVVFTLFAGSILLLYRRWRRRPALTAIGAERPDMPEAPSLAVASFVHADASWVGAESFASEVLALAASRQLFLDSPDGTRIAVRVEVLPIGSAARTEVARAMRALPATPQLDFWGSGRPPWWRTFRRHVVAEARQAGLVRHVVLGGLDARFGAAIGGLAAAVVAWTGFQAEDPVGSVAGLATTFAVLGIAIWFAGWELTDAGQRLREDLAAHRRWLARRTELGDVPAAGIVVWPEVLPVAAALGLAPRATAQVAPRWSGQPGVLRRRRWVRATRRGLVR